jgi:hypothetical protein
MAMWFSKYGGSDRISVPHASQINLTTAITLCAWVNVQTLPETVGSFETYLSKNDFYQLHYRQLYTATEFSFQYVAGTSWRSINDGVTPTLGVWFHSAGTYDNAAAGNNMIIYRNGAAVNSARYTDAILTTTTNLSIASLNTSRYLVGQLADCRIYNRALSANEIKTIYATQGHDGINYGLVGKWILDEGFNGQLAVSGSSIVIDSSKYKNHGTTYSD